MDLRNILNNDAAAAAAAAPRYDRPPSRKESAGRLSVGREASISVSPKTIPPTPVSKMGSPAASRKRSNDSFSHPQPPPKRRKFADLPIWAQRISRPGDGRPPLHRPPSSPAVKSESSDSYPPPLPAPNGHAAPTPPPPQLERSRSVAREMPPAVEPNFDNVIPYDDLTRTAADLIWDTMMGFPVELAAGDHFEIEAKLGTIIDLNTKDRIRLPIDSECAISLAFAQNVKFQSSMTTQQHQHLNKYLNQEVQRSNRPDRVAIKYQHLYETDTFYNIAQSDIAYLSPAAQFASKQKPNRAPRVRVTTDSRNGQQLAKIIKFRLEDRNYYCPKQNFDFRISVSLECDVDFDVDALPASEEGPRIKDRLSYKHQAMRMDLTQVRTQGSKVHELEVELDADEVRREASLSQSQQENQFEPLVTVFMNYIRALSRVDVVPRPL